MTVPFCVEVRISGAALFRATNIASASNGCPTTTLHLVATLQLLIGTGYETAMKLAILLIGLTTFATSASGHAVHIDMEADREATFAELHMASEVRTFRVLGTRIIRLTCLSMTASYGQL